MSRAPIALLPASPTPKVIHPHFLCGPGAPLTACRPGAGSMYLSFGFHGAARGMDLKTRAAKVAEIWKQLNWLEGYAEPGDSYLCGAELTLADFPEHGVTIGPDGTLSW